jgi:hypothetical protein
LATAEEIQPVIQRLSKGLSTGKSRYSHVYGRALLCDKSYGCDEIRDDVNSRGIDPIKSPQSNRKAAVEYDRNAYRQRNLIERCVKAPNTSVASQLAAKPKRAHLSMLWMGVSDALDRNPQ